MELVIGFCLFLTFGLLANGESDADIHFNLGVLLQREGGVAGAKVHYKAAIDKGDVNAPDIH